MNTESKEEVKEVPLFKKLRAGVFPVRPGDGKFTRLIKESGFYLFLVMASLISLSVIIAISIVL